jgi:hypothetical protein
MYDIKLSEEEIDFLHMDWGMVEEVLEKIIAQAKAQGYEYCSEVIKDK